MTINTKIGLAVLTSAAALFAAAPAAFAQDGGNWHQGFYTETAGTPDAPAATYSAQVVSKELATSRTAADANANSKGFYTETAGTPDAPAATYSAYIMNKKVAPSDPASMAFVPPAASIY